MKHNKTRKQKKGGKYSQSSGTRSSFAKTVFKKVGEGIKKVGEEAAKDLAKKTAESVIKNKDLLLQTPSLVRTLQRKDSIKLPSSITVNPQSTNPNKDIVEKSFKDADTSFKSPETNKRRSIRNTTTIKPPQEKGPTFPHLMGLSTVKKNPNELFAYPEEEVVQTENKMSNSKRKSQKKYSSSLNKLFSALKSKSRKNKDNFLYSSSL